MHQMPRSKSLLSVRELAEALVFIVATHADVVDGHDETEALKAVYMLLCQGTRGRGDCKQLNVDRSKWFS